MTELNSPPTECSSLVAVDHYLYAICGNFEDAPCSNAPFLDCQTHTWLEAPSMRLTHEMSTFDGKMYLAGSCENPESLNCIKVVNTKTQTWNPARSKKRNFNLRNMEGKIYRRISDKSGWVTKPKDWTLEKVGLYRDLPHRSICIIDKIIYVYEPIGVFEWYDSKVGVRSILLEGLEGLPKFADYSTVKLVDYGGKIMVLWDRFVSESECKEK